MTTPAPPPPVDVGRPAGVASWLLGQLVQHLADRSMAGPVVRAALHPGAGPVPWDTCCEGTTVGGVPAHGGAWARIARIYPTGPFPVEALRQREHTQRAGCGGEDAVLVELGVYRCAATLTDSGDPPAPEDVTADALVAASDAECLRLAPCGLRWPHVVRAWEPLGPAGGCHGGQLMVNVALTGGPLTKGTP